MCSSDLRRGTGSISMTYILRTESHESSGKRVDNFWTILENLFHRLHLDGDSGSVENFRLGRGDAQRNTPNDA